MTVYPWCTRQEECDPMFYAIFIAILNCRTTPLRPDVFTHWDSAGTDVPDVPACSSCETEVLCCTFWDTAVFMRYPRSSDRAIGFVCAVHAEN